MTTAPRATSPAAEPLASWKGGKRLLARRIIERIEAIPHSCYAEPFAGMGGVFLRRRARARSEILNDRNADIANLFRVLREHPDELARQFRWAVAARREFARLLQVPPGTLTDIQRAARFAYLQSLSFGGLPAHEATPGQLNMDAHGRSRMRGPRMLRLIEAAHARLQGVHVECLDWDAFMRRYDRPFTLFYLDPPYWGHENDYGKGIFERADYARMAGILGGIEGRFLLSLNDRPEVRELFGAFRIEPVRTTYTLDARHARRAGELLVSNA